MKKNLLALLLLVALNSLATAAVLDPVVISTRITAAFPIEMNSLDPYLLTANVSTAATNASITAVNFTIDGVEYAATNPVVSQYDYWWTPSSFGTHSISITAVDSDGNSSNFTSTVNVANPTADRTIQTFENALIDWSSLGSQWTYGNFTMPQSVGIYESCNAYFGTAYMKTINKYVRPADGVDVWSNHIQSFGLGQFMGYDLPTGRKGKAPTSKTYKRIYPNGGWRSTAIVSNAIGQGEVLMTPIQLANMMAAVANHGFYYTPHIIKKIKGEVIEKKYRTKHVTSINRKYFQPVIDGLFDVYNMGTAYALQVDGIEICGKTGTAENFAKINGKRTKLQDHSIFVAFAPRNNPKIAIAVLVENGYWGARWAGPITSLMIEKYLRKKITRVDLEKRMLEGSLQGEYARYTGRKVVDSLLLTKKTVDDAASEIEN